MPKGVRPGGRQKGTPNKFTKIKEDILAAFKKLGGEAFVVKCAKEDPVAVLKVIASLLPKEIDADIKGSLVLQVISGIERAPNDD